MTSRKIERPTTLDQALAILDKRREAINILAGGTDLLVHIRGGIKSVSEILDLSLLKQNLDHIKLDKNNLCIGSLCTHTQIVQSDLIRKKIPILTQACNVLGSKQIRNRGTIGGNIVNASPAGDTLPALFVLNARVKLISADQTREMSVEEFILGPGKTRLEKNEIIQEIIIPVYDKPIEGIYKKLGTRNALTIAVADVAIAIVDKKTHVAYGALAPRPIRAYQLEEAMSQKNIPLEKDLKDIIRSTVTPISDVRASAEYRKDMAANLTMIGFKELGIL